MTEILPGLILITSGGVIAIILLIKMLFGSAIDVWRSVSKDIQKIKRERGVESIYDLEEISLDELDVLHSSSRYYEECNSIFLQLKEQKSIDELIIYFLTNKHVAKQNSEGVPEDVLFMMLISKIED